MLSRCFLDFSEGERGFCHRTESDLFLFLFFLTILQHCTYFPEALHLAYMPMSTT